MSATWKIESHKVHTILALVKPEPSGLSPLYKTAHSVYTNPTHTLLDTLNHFCMSCTAPCDRHHIEITVLLCRLGNQDRRNACVHTQSVCNSHGGGEIGREGDTEDL